MEYQDFREAYAQIEQFSEEVYQRKRIHSALGYLTLARALAEFEAAWRQAPAGDGLLPKNELQSVQL